jgi:UPF0716 family protein affecting phage T7 exclusion
MPEKKGEEMPIPELALLFLLFVLAIVALVVIVVLVASAVSGTLLLKNRGKKEEEDSQSDKQTLQDVKHQ